MVGEAVAGARASITITPAARAEQLKAKLGDALGRNQRKKARKKLSRLFNTVLNPSLGCSQQPNQTPENVNSDEPEEMATRVKRQKLEHNARLQHASAAARASSVAVATFPCTIIPAQLAGSTSTPVRNHSLRTISTGAAASTTYAEQRASKHASKAVYTTSTIGNDTDTAPAAPSRASSHTCQPDGSTLLLPEDDTAAELSHLINHIKKSRSRKRVRQNGAQQGEQQADGKQGGMWEGTATGGPPKVVVADATLRMASVRPASRPPSRQPMMLPMLVAGGSGSPALDLSCIMRLIAAEVALPAQADTQWLQPAGPTSLQVLEVDESQVAAVDAQANGNEGNIASKLCRQDLSHAATVISAELSHPSDTRQKHQRGDSYADTAHHGDGAASSIHAATQQQWQQQKAGQPEPKHRSCPAPHGNYHSYYGYRLGTAHEQDPRLKLFEASWFAGRKCLDVGCNEGLVTLAVASHFGTGRMLGVDLDEVLVGKAHSNLARAVCELSEQMSEAQRLGSSGAGISAPPPMGSWSMAREAARALSRTAFRCEDWVFTSCRPSSTDTIMCLSVTKWVHLNHGDEGLRTLFNKFKRALAPGGYLILEPQPWKSYKRAAQKLNCGAVPFVPVDHLMLTPEDGFAAELARGPDGLHLIKELRGGTGSGFDRAMYLYQKPLLSEACEAMAVPLTR